jgi:hypothetical protein
LLCCNMTAEIAASLHDTSLAKMWRRHNNLER